jgi:hypothetical protein
MTLDEAVARFQQELPGWWWSVGLCKVSADGTAGVDWQGGDAALLLSEAALAFDERFDTAFRVDLHHTAEVTYTPADALLVVLADAKAAREAFLRGHALLAKLKGGAT